MSHLKNTPLENDIMLGIPAGNYGEYSQVNKFGANPISANGALEDIWDGGGTYSYPLTALITSLSQTADQSAMRGEKIEIQGLDSDWNLVVQNAFLNATDTTIIVTIDTPLIRIFRMKVLANVVSTSEIRIHNAGETIDYAIIGIGNNQTLMALYTVPKGKTAYLICYYATVTPSTVRDPKSTEFRLWTADRKNNYEFQLKHAIGLPTAGQPFTYCFEPYMKINEQTDIRMTAYCEASDGSVHAGFNLILINN